MNEKQKAYCKAKALVELLQEDRDRHMKQIRMGDTDREIDWYYNEQARYEEEIGYLLAKKALWTAEDAVIKWAEEVMKATHPDQYGKIKIAFDKGPGNIMLREKLVDICMRLNP